MAGEGKAVHGASANGGVPPTRRRLAMELQGRLPRRGQRIGLFGGSFNPAHDGHRHVTQEAFRRLALDQVWWLVSPQNPLKPPEGMAPLKERVALARRVAHHPRVTVTGIEALLGTAITADTLAALQRVFPDVHFVWLMGADNLLQFSRWTRWQEIFERVAIAVFDRPSYSLRALAAKAARRYARHRLPEGQARLVAERRPPAWVFLHIRLSSQSASALRDRGCRPADVTEQSRSGPSSAPLE